MTLQEIRESNNWDIEDAVSIYGLDATTILEIESGSKHKNNWAFDIILGILGLDYEDVIL